ncbi:MAG: cation:proton antiporter [Candidatus Kerfeldbacteria bacterium]|nr:cation:proton antiporter [Candidatus Kerfeldbacteria bacterium]
MANIFFEVSAIIIVSAGLALVTKLFKQPTVLAFMLAGVLLGPVGLNILQSHDLIDVLATFGIALMLYLVGIELDLTKLKQLNRNVLLAGFGQVLFTGLVGVLLAMALGFSVAEAWFIGVALAFSSTIIVVKLLGEQQQLDSLHGRITVAILLIQDFLAIVALLLVDGFSNSGATSLPWLNLLLVLIKGVTLAGLAWVLAKFVFKKIFLFLGNSQELLFLWSIAWCLGFAALATWWHFPIAISVFMAGVAIASLNYNYEIAARIRSLRDFFIVIFFSLLGSQLVLTIEPRLLVATVVLTLFVLIGSPLIVYIILLMLGYQPRTALFAGLALGQISEFSFILVSAGLAHGWLNQAIVAMIALIGLITMLISSYAITYNEQIYQRFKPLLQRLHWLRGQADAVTEYLPTKLQQHVVIFGYYPAVEKVTNELKKQHKTVVVVDYTPENIPHIQRTGVYYIYGDMRDEDILARAHLNTAALIISIVPYSISTLALLQYVQHFRVSADIIVSAKQLIDVPTFYHAGATFVLHPDSISLAYLQSVLSRSELNKASKLHRQEIIHWLKQYGFSTAR